MDTSSVLMYINYHGPCTIEEIQQFYKKDLVTIESHVIKLVGMNKVEADLYGERNYFKVKGGQSSLIVPQRPIEH